MGVAAYPVQAEVRTPAELARWRVIQVILLIPHLIVLFFLEIAAAVVTFIAWFAILFTGEYPQGMWQFATGVTRWQWRVETYGLFLGDKYPPFQLDSGALDPATEPALFAVAWTEKRNRLTTFFRAILVIPHAVILYFLRIAAEVVMVIAFFAVLFTKKWPDGLRDFALGVLRWNYRVNAYFGLLVDEYPPFSLDP